MGDSISSLRYPMATKPIASGGDLPTNRKEKPFEQQ
jgi:hypothetical protein